MVNITMQVRCKIDAEWFPIWMTLKVNWTNSCIINNFTSLHPVSDTILSLNTVTEEH